jgi:hypothetical protein
MMACHAQGWQPSGESVRDEEEDSGEDDNELEEDVVGNEDEAVGDDDLQNSGSEEMPRPIRRRGATGSRRSAKGASAGVSHPGAGGLARRKVSERSAWPRFCQSARGCTQFPLFGEYWDRIPRFCLEHRHDHHINVRSACRYKYMGLAANGSRVIDVRNIPVVENPTDAADAERLRKCFEAYHDCELCGAKGWVDWYYDFPFLVKRLCIRDLLDYASMEQTGRPCMSPPPEFFNQTLDGVPLGPHATIGDEEWKRFEGTLEGSDARTNKDVREADELRALIDQERLVVEGETAAQRQAYVSYRLFLLELRCKLCCHVISQL